LLLAQSARVSFSAEDGSELFAVLAFVPDTNGTQLALYTDATLTAPVETSPTIVRFTPHIIYFKIYLN
jgi:hypothetical protein